jgi:hypothetical protein
MLWWVSSFSFFSVLLSTNACFGSIKNCVSVGRVCKCRLVRRDIMGFPV